MARRRIMEYGPTVGRAPAQVTVSSVRQSIRGAGTVRIKNPKNTVTNKSVLARKQVRGILPPGFRPPNYLESSWRN